MSELLNSELLQSLVLIALCIEISALTIMHFHNVIIQIHLYNVQEYTIY